MKNVIFVLAMTIPAIVQAKEITVKVKGMVCAFCAQGIEKKFKAMPEVSSVKVSLESKNVDLATKEGKDIPDDKITKIIVESGYEVLKIERVQ